MTIGVEPLAEAAHASGQCCPRKPGLERLKRMDPAVLCLREVAVPLFSPSSPDERRQASQPINPARRLLASTVSQPFLSHPVSRHPQNSSTTASGHKCRFALSLTPKALLRACKVRRSDAATAWRCSTSGVYVEAAQAPEARSVLGGWSAALGCRRLMPLLLQSARPLRRSL